MNINSILGNIIDGVYNGPSINQREKIYNDINAEIVVIATVLPEKTTIKLSEVSGFTEAKLQITGIIAGEVNKQEIIKVQEPYMESSYRGRACMIVEGGYEPVMVDKEYIFYLNSIKEVNENSKVSYKIRKKIPLKNI